MCPSPSQKSSSIPLLLLVKQILKNAGLQTTTCLRDHSVLDSQASNANLNLLLRFQRLLFIHLFEEIHDFASHNDDLEFLHDTHGLTEDGYLEGKLSLLKKYLSLLSHHVKEVMPLAISYGADNAGQYYQACALLQKDVIGHLLPEFIQSLTLFHLESGSLLLNESMSGLSAWLQMFDEFNKMAPGVFKEDQDDMSWPGSTKYKSNIYNTKMDNNEIPQIRKADLENHNKDGGQWIVIRGKVYDVEDFRRSSSSTSMMMMESMEDITKLLEATTSQGEEDPAMIQSYYVGNLSDPDSDCQAPNFNQPDQNEFLLQGFSSPFIDLERNLSLFLGLINHAMYKSLPMSEDEEHRCSKWISPTMTLLSGGLCTSQPLNTLNDEKVVEMTTSCSILEDDHDASTDTKLDEDVLLMMMDMSKLQDPKVKTFLTVLDGICRENHLLIHMNFPEDHPVEEVGRHLLAVLIKYQGLDNFIKIIVDNNEACEGTKVSVI